MLVVGSGGREHVLAWRLSQDVASHNLHAAPGNPGICLLGRCHSVSPTDIAGLLELADRVRADLTIVGPEGPLAAGIVDAFRARGHRIFGPTQEAARLESSKVFSKELMARCGIPTAPFEVFEHSGEALDYVRREDRPLVVKADGLAGGKGVVVADTADDAEEAVRDMMIRRIHGSSGRRILIEERLGGREASVLALVYRDKVWPMLPAQDYKRAHDGNDGPNTGGMGAIAPAPLTHAVAAQIVDEILEPVAAAMVSEGHPYTGVLYAGVMLTASGPQVLEFNCRFGDPEAQVILPLTEGDLGEAMIDVLEGREPDLVWNGDAAACVVLAAGGYPGTYPTGRTINGLNSVPAGVLTFHAGTAMHNGTLVTAGGRVLNIVARGPDLDAARDRAYAGVAAVSFEGMQFRTDIGRDALPVGAGAVSAGDLR
ncbi:MAG TPA: phosphoribosylamine--glycine ligase [bacterium]